MEEIQDGLTIFQKEMFKTRSESREEAAERYHVRKHTERQNENEKIGEMKEENFIIVETLTTFKM